MRTNCVPRLAISVAIAFGLPANATAQSSSPGKLGQISTRGVMGRTSVSSLFVEVDPLSDRVQVGPIGDAAFLFRFVEH
jgi:hypothetical protein